RVLGALAGIQLVLQVHDAVQQPVMGDRKARTGAGGELGYLDLEAVLLDLLADLAGEQLLTVIVVQAEIVVGTSDEGEGLIKVGRRDRELEYFQLFAAPGVLRQAKPGLGQFAFILRLEAARCPVADKRKVAGRRYGSQFEVGDGLADHRAGFDQFNFGYRLGRPAEYVGQLGHARQATALFFHLNQGVGLINGGCQDGVGHAQQGEKQSQAGNDPFAIDQCPEKDREVDFVGTALVPIGGGDVLHDFPCARAYLRWL